MTHQPTAFVSLARCKRAMWLVLRPFGFLRPHEGRGTTWSEPDMLTGGYHVEIAKHILGCLYRMKFW
jgi:hypothetical protein